jgi:hypothetical protein
MLVRDFLNASGLTKDQLADILGHKTTSMVTKKMDVEMPVRWGRKLEELDGVPLTAVGEETTESFDARPLNDPPTVDEWENIGRDSDNDPLKPQGAETVVGPQRIKLTTVEGYITQIYSGAAYIAKSRGDDIAADTITRYSPQFAEAWIDYIKSDPRIMEYLEKMMIGTPLGNLIGIHVIAIGSYAFARIASREIAEALIREGEQGANFNGSDNFSATDTLG